MKAGPHLFPIPSAVPMVWVAIQKHPASASPIPFPAPSEKKLSPEPCHRTFGHLSVAPVPRVRETMPHPARGDPGAEGLEVSTSGGALREKRKDTNRPILDTSRG